MYEQLSEGFIIDADDPHFYLNGDEKTEEELKEVFGDNLEQALEALYTRAFSLPNFNEMQEYGRIN